MHDWPHIDAHEREELQGLADDAAQALVLAGLPLSQWNGDIASAGVEMEVDFGADAAGGLWLSWATHERLTSEAIEAVREGRADDASLRLSSAIKDAMNDAMTSILTSSGFIVEVSDDDMRPGSLVVRGRRSDRSVEASRCGADVTE